MARILKAGEAGVEGELFRIRNGRPAREGEVSTEQDLIEAGYKSPPRDRSWTWAEPGPTATELIENGPAAMRREIVQLQRELEYTLKGGQTAGWPRPEVRAERLRNSISRLRAEIAEAEAEE